ncbi:transmembrane protein 132C isoform X1 [Siniperca chuatsi]|uniref:transmembrane protein 132C isoform X1 n=1 Tax=Siniperca chuatsi TaxID=119488 RepID=UPI001CE12E0A|nr:transmembrane protein 132C isoform X1 [Siniperca chuatsi]XP_044041536.1 transmembrane protein 132C isoform X1 [Siniperca chuatsi]
MTDVSWASVRWGRRGVSMLLLFWIFIVVPPSLLQPPLPLSLPVHMSVIPPPWQFLHLSQAELGPLFSNSSPFSFSQSLFMVSPPGRIPRPVLQASFGPYSVTQHMSEPVLPLSPLVSASLLSEHVERERDEGGQERFRVRMLFHKRGDTSTRGTCITLHAFKETEEHKVSCITQPPLGLCLVTLTLPRDWFEDQHSNQSHQDLDKWHSNIHPHRRVQKREQQQGRHHHSNFVNHQRVTSPLLRYHPGVDGDTLGNFPRALRYQRGPMRNQIQLYYSSFDTVDDLELTPPGCVEDRAAQSQRQLFHIKAVTLKEEEEREQSRTKEETCLNGQQAEELILDSHVVIRYHRGPVLIGQPIRVSVNLRANFSAEFVVLRLKVKKGLVSMVAQRTLTSDLWAVTLERSQGSKHDVVSIFCHKHSSRKHTNNPTLLQQVVCLSVDGLRQSFGIAMTVSANWWVEYSGHSNPLSPHGAAVSIFSFTDRHIFGITPITESNTIINTAILTNQLVSLPVIVLAISRDGKVSDVTSAVTCHSTNENTVKVSSDCSTLFVDGSESGLGNTCAIVEFLLGTLSGSVCLEVWAPSVPLRVTLADPVLNAIDGWNHFTEKGCVPVYQRSSVQVLTQFTAQDSHSRTTHLLGSSDWFVDVTELVRNWLRVDDPRVASLGTQTNLIGLRPGKTSLHVVSEQWDGVLGRCDITVTSDPVTPGDLSVQVVSGLGMSVTASPAHPSIVTTTVTAYNILYNHHQEASISVWLQFSDDTASLLSSFSDLPFFLRLSSLAETVVVVTPSPSQRIFAQGDGGGPLLRVELLVSTCTDQPITSNSVSEGDRDWKDTGGGGGGTRRLARGSGWIRVNLELGFLQPVGDKDEEGEEFEFDISDTLVESDSDIYASNFDENENGNLSSDYYNKISGKMTNRNWNEVGNGRIVSQNNLEKAVLMPSQEEGTVYFSPSQEKGEREEEEEEEEEEGQGARELEVGVGAVLSLLCLSAVLFLANCLPCALRDRRRTTIEAKREGELEGGAKEEAERMKREGEEKMKQQQENNKKDVKEVEIIW